MGPGAMWHFYFIHLFDPYCAYLENLAQLF